MRKTALIAASAALMFAGSANAQAWLNCVPGSIAPGGCDSIAPGGGRSIAPGGGESIAPGGGRSIAPGGGLSIAPGGGLDFGPGGGRSPDRNINRGFIPGSTTSFPGADPTSGAPIRPLGMPAMPCIGVFCPG